MQERTVIFVDTSIQIARIIREGKMKASINSWLSKYGLKVTGTIALQEFKRRVLKDVAYLLTKLNQTRSYSETLHYITNLNPA